jgi:peptidoglycan/xylan/chitin deacetylase (PgdA/CDA1 family)
MQCVFLTSVWIAVVWLCGAALSGETVVNDQGVRVACFSGAREAAVSFTLDDGWEDNATIAAPLFSRYGFHATFFLVPGQIPDDDSVKGTHNYGKIPWKTWKEIAQSGHEIANHTLHHPGLTKADDATIEKEIMGAYKLIEDRIGIAPVSFAYPGNARDDRVRKFVYARHAVAREFETGYGGKDFPSASVLEEHLKYVQTLKDRVWFDTIGNVGRYVKERDAAKLEVKKVANGVSFTLTAGLDAKLFCVPLTVIVDAPGATTVEARRESDPRPLAATLGKDRILIEVVPGPGAVSVTWRGK